nr:hypothetical protein [Kofleriaceae bacterium]
MSRVTLASFTCNQSGAPCNFDLASAADRVCVLAGLTGGVAVGPSATLTSVGTEGGENFLTIYTNAGNPITATVMCAHAVNVVGPIHWSWPHAATAIPGTTASSRCFLTQVTADGGFQAYADNVGTYLAGGSWWIGGSASNYLDANATCFDATDVSEPSWGQTGGTTSGTLAPTGAIACGLTQLGGVFTTTGTSDGVAITDNARSHEWQWTFTGAHHAYADCVE